MKLLRFLVVVAVLAYAGWLAWPFLAPFIEGAGQPEAAVRAGPAAPGGEVLFGVIPVWTAWVVLGLLVAIAGRRIRRPRTPGQFAY